MRHGVAAAGLVWLARESGGQERVPEIIGVAVEDPDAPRVLASTVVADPDARGRVVVLAPMGDRQLIMVAASEDRATVTALQTRPDGTVRVQSRLAVPDVRPELAGAWIVEPDRPVSPGVAVAEEFVYLGLSSELVAVDVRNPEHLMEASRIRLEDADRFRPYGSRHVVLHGGCLHVARHWPRELVVMGLSDPGSPRQMDTEYYRSPMMGAHRVDGLLYKVPSLRAGIAVYDPSDLAARPVPVFHEKVAEQGWRWMAGAPLAIDGQLLATIGDHLAVFTLPERLRGLTAHAGAGG
ncbi:hypothetical protein ACFL6X_05730 [Candidatus Latescibacterota bacterium]